MCMTRITTLILLAAMLSLSQIVASAAPPHGEMSARERIAALPTERSEATLELGSPDETPWTELLRPQFGLAAEWQPQTDGVEVNNYDLKITQPTYPIYGPPPPMLTFGSSYTSFTSPQDFPLPESLYDFSLGGTWIRPLTPRWMLRIMASAAYASDLHNNSSDAWQFRGGLFATYQWTKNLNLLVGAFASGRDDLPVLPGIGAIWTPTPFWRVDLMMPRPRVSYLLAHSGTREHWIFLAAGLSGGTWAFEDDRGQAILNDKLTYREFRVALGWESAPPRRSRLIPGRGRKWEAQIGYVFGREFEFERQPRELSIDSALMLRVGAKF